MRFLSGILLAVFALSPAFAETPQVKKAPWYRVRNEMRPKLAPGAPVVVNAASYLLGVSPGGLATIFGNNLTDVSGVVVPNSNPLPTQLSGVQVVVNGVLAPLFSVAYVNGEDQISFQVPYETPTGPGAAQIQVLDYGHDTGDLIADSFTEDPGIFSYLGGYAIAENGTTGQLIDPNHPAFPGDILVLYTTGLGPLSTPLVDGYGAPSFPLATTVDPFSVYLAGEQCSVLFSGLAPGFVGLYQVNFIVPNDAPIGDLDLQIRSPYADSNTVKLTVH